jgi:hypothetical protein
MYVACKAALGAPPFFLDNPPEMLLVTLVRGIVTIITILRVSIVSIIVDTPCQIRWLDRPISTLAPYILAERRGWPTIYTMMRLVHYYYKVC